MTNTGMAMDLARRYHNEVKISGRISSKAAAIAADIFRLCDGGLPAHVKLAMEDCGDCQLTREIAKRLHRAR